MKNENCPKCGNTDIAIFKPATFNARVNGNILMNHIPVGFMKSARIQHYVCRKCGYLEHYIIDEDVKKL